MANLKLHTIGIHGGFHHNFLCTVVRTVREKQRTKLVIESLHLLDLPRMSWDFLLPSSSLIYACSTLSHSSSSVFLWPSFPYPFSNHLNQFKFGPYYSARGCLRARAHFTFGRGDALHSPLAVGSASLSTFLSLLLSPLQMQPQIQYGDWALPLTFSAARVPSIREPRSPRADSSRS